MGKLKVSAEADTTSTNKATVDRLILKPEASEKINNWLTQLNEKYEGLIKFSKSDIANFIIQNHDNQLSEAQLKSLGAEFYDEITWINKAIDKVKKARRDGLQITLDELMQKRSLFSVEKSASKKRKIKSEPIANDITLVRDQVEDI